MKTNTKIKAMMVLILVLVCVFVSLNIGSYPLSFEQIVRVLFQDPIKEMDVQVFYQLRLPRVLMGLMCGFTFGLCGAIFQLMFHNPLASPDLIGVSSGASLGAACMIVLGAGSVMEIMAGSFLGGMLILGAVIALVNSQRQILCITKADMIKNNITGQILQLITMRIILNFRHFIKNMLDTMDSCSSL